MCNLYKFCNGCPYYYGEIDDCMYGEDDVPSTPEDRKCGPILMYSEYRKKIYEEEEIDNAE